MNAPDRVDRRYRFDARPMAGSSFVAQFAAGLGSLAAAVWLLFVPALAHADSWLFPATIESEVEVHGDTSVRRTLDAREKQKFPDYSIEVSRGNELLARVPGVYFEKLFPAPDGSFFVGLSNSGLPGTAVIIFDREGRLYLEVKHGPAEFDYCERSITLDRTWFDAARPDVRFTRDNKGSSYRVTLRSCRGDEINLESAIREAHNRAFQRAR